MEPEGDRLSGADHRRRRPVARRAPPARRARSRASPSDPRWRGCSPAPRSWWTSVRYWSMTSPASPDGPEHARRRARPPRRRWPGSEPERVRHDDDRASLGAEVGEPLVAPPLELLVADGQHLVDEQDVGVDVDGHREAEAHVHPRRVVLHRGVDEALEPGELDDVVEAPVELGLGEPEDRAVEVDVLPPGQLGVEAGAELEQRRHLAARAAAALVGLEDPGQALQQRALARAVGADEAVRDALGDLERDVAQRPELLVAGPGDRA